MNGRNHSHEVELEGIHVFGHQVFTTTISIGVVLTIEVWRIDKGTRIGKLHIEFIVGRIDESHTWRQSMDNLIVLSSLAVVPDACIHNQLVSKVMFVLQEERHAALTPQVNSIERLWHHQLYLVEVLSQVIIGTIHIEHLLLHAKQKVAFHPTEVV